MDDISQKPAPAPPSPSPPPAPQQPQYEFTDAQNEVIKNLSGFLAPVGLVIVFAALAGAFHFGRALYLGAFTGDVWMGLWFGAALLLAFLHGGWLLRASESFQKIVDTKGSDIDYLMDALKNLQKFFTLLGIAAVVFIIFAIVRAISMLF